MKISKELIQQLLEKLKIGTTRGIHLNASAGRNGGRIDIADIIELSSDFKDEFLERLLTKEHFKLSFTIGDIKSKKAFLAKNGISLDDENYKEWEDKFKQKVNIAVKRLGNINKQSDDYESNSGINTFGFGFPMIARSEKTILGKDQNVIAPLVIRNLNIKTDTKHPNTFIIENTEDNYFMNNEILESHIEIMSHVKMPKMDIENIDFLDKEELHKFIKTFMGVFSKEKIIPEMKIEAMPDVKGKLDNTFSLYWSGTFGLYKQQNQAIKNSTEQLLELYEKIFDGDPCDLKFEHSFGLVDSDPTQQYTLDSLKMNKDLIIQGPPGTGKSQTITALLTNNLTQGHTSLVVCEKRTALEVILKNLEKLGLDQFCTLIEDPERDRKTTVMQVRNFLEDYNDCGYGEPAGYSFVLGKYQSLIQEINTQHQAIGKKIFGESNRTNTVGMLLKTKRNVSEDGTTKELENFINDNAKDNIELNELYENLDNILTQGAKLYTDKSYKLLKHINYDAIKSGNKFDGYEAYSQQIQNIKSQIEQTKFDTETIQSNIQAFSDLVYGTVGIIRELTKNIGEYRVYLSNKECFLSERKLTATFYKKVNTIKKAVKELDSLLGELHKLSLSEKISDISMKNINRIEVSLGDISCKVKDELVDLNNHLNDIKIVIDDIEGLIKEGKKIYGDDFDDKTRHFFLEGLIGKLNTKVKEKSELKDNIFSLSDTLVDKCNNILDGNLELTDSVTISGISELLQKIKRDFDFRVSIEEIKLSPMQPGDEKEKEIRSGLEKIQKDVLLLGDFCGKVFNFDVKEVNYDCKTIDVINNNINYVSGLVDGKELSLDDFIDLTKRGDLYCRIDHKGKDVLDMLINNSVSTACWNSYLGIAYLNRILKRNFHEDNIPRDEENIKELIGVMANFKLVQSSKVKSLQLSNRGAAIRKFKNNHLRYTIEGLYNLRKGKNVGSKKSLRNIIAEDFEFFTSFFPIVLTTPSACAEIFRTDKKMFDVVVFDEASQLKLEDTLHCLIRGKRKIVCGDDKQMPPSTFFESSISGDKLIVDGDDDDVFDPEFAESESLLDFCTKIGEFESRMLRIHYRSEHPDLIQFSNHAYYNGKLQPFPPKKEYTPIHLMQINGLYEDRMNDKEAEEVVKLLKNILSNYDIEKLPSIGIGTFNVSQRNLILDKLNKIKGEESEFADKLNSYNKNTFFVKNLDSLQGDERDIIIISTTFGKNRDGKFLQNFGPINNKDKGHRFLNVMVSRAKKELYVLTSIPEDQYMGYEDAVTACGGALQRAGLYARLAYCKAVSEGLDELKQNILVCINPYNKPKQNSVESGLTESPFEEEVVDILSRIVPADNKIVLQKEEAGFRLDIAIFTKSGTKIAIECDGAAYHSSDQAYAWDVFRQKRIEENCGYVFHRIWSTNRWLEQDKEVQKMTEFLREYGVL